MMFAIPLLNNLDSVIQSFTGNIFIVALVIVGFFAIGFLMSGIPFRFVMLLMVPLMAALASSDWFPGWVQAVFWFVVVGIGLFLFSSLWQRS